MKSTIAYYLLLLYLTVMIHPILPIVCDAWSHAFSEINHLAIVHAKYGSHHVEMALAKSIDNNNSKNKNSNKINLSDTDHILIWTENRYSGHQLINSFPLFDKNNLPAIFLLKHTPPPKFTC